LRSILPTVAHEGPIEAATVDQREAWGLLRKKVDQKEATTMAQDNEHVQKLIAARDREVAHRGDIAEVLAEKHDRGDMENMGEAFIKIQDVIEAIERAVWHERYIASQKARAVLAFRLRKRAVTGATGRARQFWGHDRALEASFFVTDDALRRVTPNMQFDEDGVPRAFDLNRNLIYEITAKVYEHGRKDLTSWLPPIFDS
jgi:hypothetical protein